MGNFGQALGAGLQTYAGQETRRRESDAQRKLREQMLGAQIEDRQLRAQEANTLKQLMLATKGEQAMTQLEANAINKQTASAADWANKFRFQENEFGQESRLFEQKTGAERLRDELLIGSRERIATEAVAGRADVADTKAAAAANLLTQEATQVPAGTELTRADGSKVTTVRPMSSANATKIETSKGFAPGRSTSSDPMQELSSEYPGMIFSEGKSWEKTTWDEDDLVSKTEDMKGVKASGMFPGAPKDVQVAANGVFKSKIDAVRAQTGEYPAYADAALMLHDSIMESYDNLDFEKQLPDGIYLGEDGEFYQNINNWRDKKLSRVDVAKAILADSTGGRATFKWARAKQILEKLPLSDAERAAVLKAKPPAEIGSSLLRNEMIQPQQQAPIPQVEMSLEDELGAAILELDKNRAVR